MTEKVFGIDFGTTNTVVFSADDGKLENIKLKGKVILPSTVNYDSENSFDLGEQNDKSIFSIKTAILRRYRVKEIWMYAIAFWDKECKVVAKQATQESRR